MVYGTLVVPRIRISVESAVLSGEENAFAFCAGDSARYSPSDLTSLKIASRMNWLLLLRPRAASSFARNPESMGKPINF